MLQLQPNERILLAFDKSRLLMRDNELIETTAPWTGGTKVGLEAILAHDRPGAPSVGDQVRGIVQSKQRKLMWDQKLNDIPNTVGNAVQNIASRGVWGITVMASTGRKSLQAAVQNRGEANIIGVSVLTSLSPEECKAIYGRIPSVQVSYFAEMLVETGAQAIVCSPLELEVVRKSVGDKLFCITPGIRAKGAPADDQNRTMPAGDAVKAGADYLVIGRPIMAAEDPSGAARAFCDEIAAAQDNVSMV